MLGVVALSACQKGEGGERHRAPPPAGSGSVAAAADTPYARDLGRICDAEKLSGADQQPEGARQLAIAQWLGPAIETEEARDFLAALTQFDGPAKAQRLRAEAAKVGIADCALASVWQ